MTDLADPSTAFIAAACVPLDSGHTTGTLDRAEAILAAHPEVATREIHAATALLDAGADPNTGFHDANHQPEPGFESALYGVAGVAHHAALARLLLERGAEPNDEEVPYHAPEGWDNGAPIQVEDGNGRTPLALAVRACVDSYWSERRSPESVQALLQAGASCRGLRWPSGYAPVDDLLRAHGAGP